MDIFEDLREYGKKDSTHEKNLRDLGITEEEYQHKKEIEKIEALQKELDKRGLTEEEYIERLERREKIKGNIGCLLAPIINVAFWILIVFLLGKFSETQLGEKILMFLGTIYILGFAIAFIVLIGGLLYIASKESKETNGFSWLVALKILSALIIGYLSYEGHSYETTLDHVHYERIK